MKIRYKLLQSSCINIATLYNTYEVGEEPDKKKSLIFFNEEIEKYRVEEDLEYNVLIFKRQYHANILHMIDRIEYDHGQEHMFEYYENSLESYVINFVGKIHEKQVLDILKQIINAVDGIISRKCYPQNLRPEHFVQVRGNWKIRCVVFGQDDSKCKDLDSEYMWNPYYLPPQLYQKGNQISLSSELVWSVGCIGLFLVQKQHKLSTLNAIKQTYNKQFNNLSPKLSQFFKNTLNPNPSKRVKWAQIKEFLQNPQKKVNFKLSTQLIQNIDKIEEDLRMSKSMKLKQSSQYFMINRLNQSVKFGLKSVFQMPDSLLRSRNDVRMELAESQFGKLTMKNTKLFGKQTVYNITKGSKLLIQSGRSINGNNQDNEQQDDNNFLHEIRQRHQTNQKNRQFFVLINQKIPQSTQKKINYRHDLQLNIYKQIYRKLETLTNIETKHNLLSIINAYRQQRQVSQFCFHLRQEFQNFILTNQQKIISKLAQCTFLLLAIINTNQIFNDLIKGQCRFNLNPSIFKQLKKLSYYEQIKNTFQLSYQRYVQHFAGEVQRLKQFYYSKGCTMEKYCEYLIKICNKEELGKITIDELKKEDYLSLMSKLYDKCKKQYNKTLQLQLQKLMIKLLVVRVSDKIIISQNKCVFQDYFNWINQIKPVNLYLLQYLNFLDDCQDIKILQSHKDKIAKHKYVG